MKKERSLYIKSIVICTTGPLVIAKSLFGDYVLTSAEFNEQATPMSFNHYGLKKAFQSQNSIPLHETVLGMLRFLGAADGDLNDSSWLEEGVTLQKERQVKLEARQRELQLELPHRLHEIKCSVQTYIKTLERESTGPFSFFRRDKRETTLASLREVLACFDEDSQTFNLATLRKGLATSPSTKKAGIIAELEKLCTEAQVLGLATELKPIDFKAKHAFSLRDDRKENERYFTLDKPRMGWREVALFVLKSPFLLIRWFISFLLARPFALAILAPTDVIEQRAVHHVSMSDVPHNTADDLVIVNLIPHESNKSLKDSVLKLIEFMRLPIPSSMKRRELDVANSEDKKQLDTIISDINKLRSGTSGSKRCNGIKFEWDKIHFKGMEMLSEDSRDYLLKKIGYPEGGVTERGLYLDFFTLASTEGAVLDSVEISAGDERVKPMSERTFVINCLAREQNYVNWIKDGAYSAKEIGCTVIAFNYRGIDYSKGMVWNQDNMVDDAVAQVERLLALAVPAKNIGIEGDCLGASIATLAVAKLQERHYPVKLYNLRSFRSLPRFLEGYLLPETSTKADFLNPLTYLKYIAVGFIRCVLMPLIWVARWDLNVATAWNSIPSADKDYGVIRNSADAQGPNEVDGCIHNTWASVASIVDEQRKTLQAKETNKERLTQEQIAVLDDSPARHCFKPDPKPQSFDSEAAKEKAQTYGSLPHFLGRRSLLIREGEEGATAHNHMVDFFKTSFRREAVMPIMNGLDPSNP